MALFTILVCLFFPALALWAEQRFSIVKKLGAVILCYIVGISLSALGLSSSIGLVQDVYGIAALLAVPSVLFSADVRSWLRLARPTLLAFVGAVIAAVTGALLAFSIAGGSLEQGNDTILTGMAVGVYTGGTPNLNAIALALGAPENLILQANVADTLFFLPYFFFVMTIGPKVIGWILPVFPKSTKTTNNIDGLVKDVSVKPFQYLLALIPALISLALALGLSFLLTDELDMAIVVSAITVAGLAFSFIPQVRNLPGTYQTGEYLLLIFCVGIGMSIDAQSLTTGFLPVILFMFVAAGLGFVIHLVLSWFFKVDVDTFIITSVAAICSPLFVPPVARALGNKEIITSGMTTGVLGFAVGNGLGLAIAHLLS